MKLLEQRILVDGHVAAGNILKVDSFINHCIDVDLMQELGREFHRLFDNCGVNKILTIEASGIGIACITAQFFHCPVLFAKKAKSLNISGDVYTAEAFSYTSRKTNKIIVSKDFLTPDDRVLIIDDFLANGSALSALIDIVEQAGASLAGCGIIIEKAYQEGGGIIRRRGIRVESLACIESMESDQGIKFKDDII